MRLFAFLFALVTYRIGFRHGHQDGQLHGSVMTLAAFARAQRQGYADLHRGKGRRA